MSTQHLKSIRSALPMEDLKGYFEKKGWEVIPVSQPVLEKVNIVMNSSTPSTIGGVGGIQVTKVKKPLSC